MKEERKSNYELLRIVSMFFIVLYHTIHHGNLINNCTNEALKSIFEMIMLIIVVHVNSFVLVSGYFQSKSNFKQSKLWSIINANWFYKAIIAILFGYLGITAFTTVEMFMNLFPLNLEEYWFINPYLIIYCLSPFLNKFIESLSKRDYQKLLLVLFTILSFLPYITSNRIYGNDGFTLYNFITLYLIGGYLRRYPLKESYLFKFLSTNAFQILMIIVFVLCAIINYSFNKTADALLGQNPLFDFFGHGIINMTRAYSNPLIMIQSVAYFTVFSTINFKSKFINKLSSATLGVYFIHDNKFVRENIYKWIGIDQPIISSYKYVLYAIIVAFVIYTGCTIIELIRQLIFKALSKLKIARKIRENYYNYIKGIYIKRKV